MFFIPSSFKKTKGFSLIEISLGLIIASVSLSMLMQKSVRDGENALVEREVGQLLSLRSGLETYIKTYHYALIHNQAIYYPEGAVDLIGNTHIAPGDSAGETRAPLLEQLQTLGLLDKQATLVSLLDHQSYQVGNIAAYTESAPSLNINLLDSNNACKTNNCTLSAHVYIDLQARTSNEGGLQNTQTSGTNIEYLKKIEAQLGDAAVAPARLSDQPQALQPSDPLPAATTSRLAAYASTQVISKQISMPQTGIDFCPAGVWVFDNASVSAPSSTSSEQTGLCYAPHGDLSVGISYVASDLSGSYKGQISLVCLPDEENNFSLRILDAITAYGPTSAHIRNCSANN